MVISSPASAFLTATYRTSSGTEGAARKYAALGQMGKSAILCGFEPLGHAHKVLGSPLAPAKFGLEPEPREELAVRQVALDGQQVVTNPDDVLDGLLDSPVDPVGDKANLVADLRFEQVVAEPEDDQFAPGLLGQGMFPVEFCPCC
jgi:hypothetical protein